MNAGREVAVLIEGRDHLGRLRLGQALGGMLQHSIDLLLCNARELVEEVTDRGTRFEVLE
jgi:hypothetical protein